MIFLYLLSIKKSVCFLKPEYTFFYESQHHKQIILLQTLKFEKKIELLPRFLINNVYILHCKMFTHITS